MKNKKHTQLQRIKTIEKVIGILHNRQQAILHKLEMIKPKEDDTKES